VEWQLLCWVRQQLHCQCLINTSGGHSLHACLCCQAAVNHLRLRCCLKAWATQTRDAELALVLRAAWGGPAPGPAQIEQGRHHVGLRVAAALGHTGHDAGHTPETAASMPAAALGHAWSGPLHPGGVGCSWKRPQEKGFDLGGHLWTVGPLPGRTAGVHIWMAGCGQQASQSYINNRGHWKRSAIDYRM